MSALADDFAPALAIELIDLFGISGVFTVPGSSEFDEIKGEKVNKAVTPVTITMSPPTQYKKTLKSADIVEDATHVSYMKGNESFVPKNMMEFTLSGKTWRIIEVRPLVSGEQVAAYRLYVA